MAAHNEPPSLRDEDSCSKPLSHGMPVSIQLWRCYREVSSMKGEQHCLVIESSNSGQAILKMGGEALHIMALAIIHGCDTLAFQLVAIA